MDLVHFFHFAVSVLTLNISSVFGLTALRYSPGEVLSHGSDERSLQTKAMSQIHRPVTASEKCLRKTALGSGLFPGLLVVPWVVGECSFPWTT